MRKRGKSGLIATLFAAGASFLAGCGSAKPTDYIEALKRARRAQTPASIENFDKGMKTIGQKALNNFSNTAVSNEATDLATIAAAEAERNRIIGLGNQLSQQMQGTTGGNAPKYGVPNTNASNKDSSITISGTATGRLDGESEITYGGKLEYRTNGTSVSIGATSPSSTTVSNASGDLTRTWSNLDLCVGKYKNFGNWNVNAGIGLNQEEISTEGIVGNTYIDDADTKNTPYVKIGGGYSKGMLNINVDLGQTVVKGDDNNYSTTCTVSAGVKF